MRKFALITTSIVLGVAGPAAADDYDGDGYDDGVYADGVYDDGVTYDDTTYPTTATYGDWIVPQVAIPAPQPIVVQPRHGFVWVDGYWRWTGYDWTWVDGHWVRERPNYLYVQGRWELNRGRHRWVSGYWQPRTKVIVRNHYRDHRRFDRDRDHRRSGGWHVRNDRRFDRDRRVDRDRRFDRDRGNRRFVRDRSDRRDHRRGNRR